MQYLTPENAQKIADRIMEIVPYNINIMNKEGIIIASGDKERIHTVHKGAVKALEMRESYIVYQDTETERKGINLPIFFNYDIAGVIGISGDVDKVMQIGRIVVTTAQLMIENDVYNDISAIKESRLNDFFHEWIQRTEAEYNEKLLSQADYYNIDMSKVRTAVYIHMKRVRYSVIEQLKAMLTRDDYIVRQSMEYIMILFLEEPRLGKRLGNIMNISPDLESCYIGEPDSVARNTVLSAEKTFEIATLLHCPQRIITHDQLRLPCLLRDIPISHGLKIQMEKLMEKDEDGHLRDTIIAYMEYGDDLKAVCGRLFIHRNTLNYRLDKIMELTGLNPKKGKDLMMLYILVLHIIMNQEAEGDG